MEVVYADSQPGTLVYAFPENGNLADWGTARVQLIESASPNTGRWIGDLGPGRWRIFEGSAQPAAFSESVYVYVVPSDSGAGAGPRTVTITVNLEGQPLQNAVVRIESGAIWRQSTTGLNGQVVFNVSDATFSVSITAEGCEFGGATLVVDGNENPVYPMTRLSTPPISIGNGSTGVCRCVSKANTLQAGVSIGVQIVRGPGQSGMVYEGKPIVVASDESGYCYFPNLIRGAEYRICFKNVEQGFVVPDADSFDLPEIVTV